MLSTFSASQCGPFLTYPGFRFPGHYFPVSSGAAGAGTAIGAAISIGLAIAEEFVEKRLSGHLQRGPSARPAFSARGTDPSVVP